MLDKYFFLWAPPPLSPTPFLASPFIVVFLVVFFCSCMFFVFKGFFVFFSFFFFLLCYFVIVKHTHRNILTTIDLQFSEIYIIGLLVVLLHVLFSECWF